MEVLFGSFPSVLQIEGLVECAGQGVFLVLQQCSDGPDQYLARDSGDGVKVGSRLMIKTIALPDDHLAAQTPNRGGDGCHSDKTGARPALLAFNQSRVRRGCPR